MDENVVDNVYQIVKQHIEKFSDRQVWVGIIGPPGAGKSTIATALRDRVSNSIVVPMDGFHLYKSQLMEMEDSSLALRKRGSHWTFDAEKFVSTLMIAKQKGEGVFPSFDHSVGDPVEGSIVVTREHDVVIVEGLYLLLPNSPWNELKNLLDVTIFIDCDMDTLRRRLVSRHMNCFNMSEEQAVYRAEDNDLPNAIQVLSTKYLLVMHVAMGYAQGSGILDKYLDDLRGFSL